jgi:hypothetical protein
MPREITPAVESEPQLEIGEKRDDTRGLVIGSRIPTRGLAVAVAATQVLNTGSFLIDDVFTPRDMTGYRNEELVAIDHWIAEEMSEEPRSVVSPADSANQSRLELLAREYVAGQLSTEESARVAIVSERVRRLIPRVTLEDFERLEAIGRELKEIESDNAELRRRIEFLKNI